MPLISSSESAGCSLSLAPERGEDVMLHGVRDVGEQVVETCMAVPTFEEFEREIRQRAPRGPIAEGAAYGITPRRLIAGLVLRFGQFT